MCMLDMQHLQTLLIEKGAGQLLKHDGFCSSLVRCLMGHQRHPVCPCAHDFYKYHDCAEAALGIWHDILVG